MYGVNVVVDPDLTVARLLQRKDVVEQLETERIHANLDRHEIDLCRGEARLQGPNEIEVSGGDRLLEAEFVLLATGSSPYRPAGIPHDDESGHDAGRNPP